MSWKKLKPNVRHSPKYDYIVEKLGKVEFHVDETLRREIVVHCGKEFDRAQVRERLAELLMSRLPEMVDEEARYINLNPIYF